MADPNTRQGKRTPVTLKIKFKSETLEQFIERYAVDVSQGGIFIRTKEPLAVGTQMRFEFQLRDASPLIGGEGTVVWTRENDPSRPAIAPGMGVRFDRLAEGSQTVLERILSEKAKQAPQRTGSESTKPPMFTDTPTRVAPTNVQDALLGDKRRPVDNFGEQGTPLPKPMPFHSDADDFDEQAFEEATKVRALDELIAQTAGDDPSTATAIIPADELAARRTASSTRADSTLADPPAAAAPAAPAAPAAQADERESAPTLPSPPEAGLASAAKAQPRLLDTTPSPRTTEPPPMGAAKTQLGVEAPKPVTVPPPIKEAVTRPSGIRAVATEPSAPTKLPVAPAKKSSAVPMIILLLVLVAAGAAGVWFFYLRPKAQEQAAQDTPATTPPARGSAIAAGGGSAGSDMAGSAGSADSMAAGSAGSATEAPAGPLVDTPITASTDKATVEVVGTDQKGPAPFTAKLEKDRAYKVRVSAPGFATTELDVKGGDAKVAAKLAAKPRIIKVTSEPAGALILVDNAATKLTTPADVELTKSQAAQKTVRITLRKGGFRPVTQVVAADAFTESDAQLEAAITATLPVAPVIRTVPSRGSAAPPDGGEGSDTTTPPAETGSGATPPTPPTPPTTTPPTTTPSTAPTTPPAPPAGAGTAAKPTTAPAAGSAKPAEPEPDFVK